MKYVKISILISLVIIGIQVLAKFSHYSPTYTLILAPIYFTALVVLIVRSLMKIIDNENKVNS
jgi:hypothetical protein